ncbi:Processing alpha glucosidase I [Apophysomyces sp. BC1034]|nr:Processing alpha glucosidase I [Apophysomyces sp. BC1015]KAG0174865.1 Processing alpha glucosidase I [Apophysomyces sp. BC1021]KAG0185907.1 Processing alpha glucosidase I [Apophysomyces sp. BC1034]
MARSEYRHGMVLWYAICTIFVAMRFAAHGMLMNDEAMLVASANQATNTSLFWGTYRPNLYFGTRPRLPTSVMTGLMWFDGDDFQGFQRIRHACDQNDGINGYGYHKHDGRRLAIQKIRDDPSNVAITTEFVKVPGGNNGGDWGVRVRGTLLDDSVSPTTSVMFYIGLEGEGSMDITSKTSSKGLESPVKMEGDTPELGDFEFQIVDDPLNEHPVDNDRDLSLTQWWGVEVPEDHVWRAKDYALENMIVSAREKLSHASQEDAFARPYAFFTLTNTLTEEEDQLANFYVFQKVFKGNFQFDVLFRSQSSPEPITSTSLTDELSRQEEQFDARFEKTFHLQQKGFSSDQVEFANFLLSNLIGGVGYFYGSSVVDRSRPPMQDEESFTATPQQPEQTSPQVLFSASPSRPFFPRGFYWDEGFHQMLIGKWDNDLSLDMIKHWMSLIDENGWIAREQILGEEARSKVPAEFQTQFPHHANPPTLYLAIKQYVDRLTGKKEGELGEQQSPLLSSLDDSNVLQTLHLENFALAQRWLYSIYPKLRLNWQWFRSTQRGHLERFGRSAPNAEAYRWRGRTPDHTLTSGLDDYPRGEPPNVGELHVDLLSWMAFGTRLLKDISAQLGPDYAADVEEYTQVEKDMLENLELLHWNEENQAFCDQTIDEGRPVHVCHKGYMSLFPMALGLLSPDSEKLGAILDMIQNEDELWSPYGLRSLSASDALYNTGEVYWRGPIWININFLTLQSLHNNYMHVPGPYQQRAQTIYTALRENIIDTVYKSYKETGYVWEQYSPENGKGLRSHPFTGWTSLVLLIMAEEY